MSDVSIGMLRNYSPVKLNSPVVFIGVIVLLMCASN